MFDVIREEMDRRRRYVRQEVLAGVPEGGTPTPELLATLEARLAAVDEAAKRPLTVGDLKVILADDYAESFLVRIVKGRLTIVPPGVQPEPRTRRPKEAKHDPRKAVLPRRRRRARGQGVRK